MKPGIHFVIGQGLWANKKLAVLRKIKVLCAILSSCSLAVFCSGCVMAEYGAIDQAQSGMAAGKYDYALAKLMDAGHYAKTNSTTIAEIVYLEGVCYDGMGRPDEGKALYKFVAAHYPDTQYGYMAQAKLTNNDTFMSVGGPAIFSAYDSRFFSSISNSWHRLLKPVEPKIEKGIVVLRFNLHSDGKITDLKITRNTVTRLLASICQKAVLEPAPYEKWTPEMVVAQGRSYRTITFTFYYRP